MSEMNFLNKKLIGAQRELIVGEDGITLVQIKNVRSLLTSDYFNGTKTIKYRNILGVQFKKASGIILGYIQFETASSSGRSNFGSENSWTFDANCNDIAEEVVEYVNNKIEECYNEHSGKTTMSNADEILKYKQLLDSGIITQEEFDEKKNQILKPKKSGAKIEVDKIEYSSITPKNENVTEVTSLPPRPKNSILAHIVLFWFTFGIGNIIYYIKVKKDQNAWDSMHKK